ncbi:MAG: HAD hydrolase-like protein [Eisenbergiella sp.]
MFSYILFDLDGTLSDPKQGICGSVQYALKSFGIEEPDIDRIEPFIGPPLRDSFMKYYGFTPEQAEEAVAKYRERFSVTGKYENTLYPGIAPLLHDLVRAGAKLAIASSKPTVYVEDILVHFGIRQYFDIVVGSELDGTRDRKEEVVDEALRQLDEKYGAKPCEVVMVGDRCFDVEGAKAAGTRSVAVTYGYAQPGELEQAGADIIVRDVEGLRQVLMGGAGQNSWQNAGQNTRTGERGQIPPVGSSSRYRSNAWHSAGQSSAAGTWQNAEQEAGQNAGQYSGMSGSNPRYDKMRDFWKAIGVSALAMGTYYLVSIAISTGVLMLSMIMTPVLDVFGIGARENTYNLWMNLANALATAGAFAACFGIWHKQMNFKAKRSIDGLSLVPMAILAAASAVGMNGLLNLIELYRFSPTFQEISEIQFDTPVWLGIISYGILAPLGEEVVFRGVVYGQFKKVMKVPIAIVLSGLAFGLFHGNLVQAVYATVIGILLALVYELYGTLIAPMVFHGIANLFVYIMLDLTSFGGAFLTPAACIIFLALSVVSVVLMCKLQKKQE